MNNVVLVGFMGTGKTTVGRQLADRLQRPFVDLDQEIEADAGRSVTEIFSGEGESAFRHRESRRLRDALERDGAVIAAGGGAPLADDNWRRMRAGNTVVALTAEPAELARRLAGSNGRPLLQPDPPAAIATLLPSRMERYREADLLVATDSQDASALATTIAERLPRAAPQRIGVDVPGAEHEVLVGEHLTGLVATAAARLAQAPNVLLVTDEALAGQHAGSLLASLAAQNLRATQHVVPVGEAAKELVVLQGIYQALAEAGIERHGLLVALGGGTVGDVSGFAAATWMRGIRYLQVPTTLLAMVDSSIGGKTGINLPAGKNMVGAVHQPSAIFCDLAYLGTLPDADFRASLAEVIKAALIGDRSFVDWLGVNLSALTARAPAAVLEAVTRSVRIKAAVVSRDPWERGERALLNYGHTVGHALERTLGYGRVRHGEAVAWGMEVAARISVLTGSCTQAAAALQHDLLGRAGLLAVRLRVDRTALLEALRHDKKSFAGDPRWVLLRAPGEAAYGQSVDASIVSSALDEVLGA